MSSITLLECLATATQFRIQPQDAEFSTPLSDLFCRDTIRRCRFRRIPRDLILVSIEPVILPDGDFLATALCKELQSTVGVVPSKFRGHGTDLDVVELLYRRPRGFRLPKPIEGPALRVTFNRRVIANCNWVTGLFAGDGDLQNALGILEEVVDPAGRFARWKGHVNPEW